MCGVTSDELRAWVEEKKKLFCVGPQTGDKLRATFRSAGYASERLFVYTSTSPTCTPPITHRPPSGQRYPQQRTVSNSPG